jgi:hypothetical protein
MKVEITNQWFEGREYFEFTLYDGPDCSERAHGYSVDLIEAFTKIIEWREMISRDYEDLPVSSSGYATGESEISQCKHEGNSETN